MKNVNKPRKYLSASIVNDSWPGVLPSRLHVKSSGQLTLITSTPPPPTEAGTTYYPISPWRERKLTGFKESAAVKGGLENPMQVNAIESPDSPGTF